MKYVMCHKKKAIIKKNVKPTCNTRVTFDSKSFLRVNRNA